MTTRSLLRRLAPPAALVVGLLATLTFAQSRLPQYPGYAQFQKMTEDLRNGETFVSGALNVTWTDGGQGFNYTFNGQSYHYDIATKTATATAPATGRAGRGGRGRGRGAGAGRGFAGGPPATGTSTTTTAPALAGRDTGGRGGAAPITGSGGSLPTPGIARRLADSAASPDGQYNAYSHDGNVFLTAPDGAEWAVTTEGSTKSRIRYGVPTIVYGEELGAATGLWWSPDSKKLAFYRFDESKVPDYTIVRTQVPLYNSLEIDPYPKAGIQSPRVDLYIYDLATRKTTQVDVRDGKPFADSTVGYYVYRVAWSPDGKDLLFSRMNRRQNTFELTAADPATGKCRVIVHDEWPANWVLWDAPIEYLPDHQRFIITSERNGFKNFYLYNLSGTLLATLTHHDYEVANLLKIVEDPALPGGGRIYYMARDGDNYMKLQLHRVNLDGSDDKRLTDPAFNHTISIAPDNQHFVDVIQTHDTPPATRLLDAEGHPLADLAKSDMTRFDQLGLKRVELFTFKTFDGTAELHGMLNFPSNFDPSKKYPLLVSVYGGPITSAAKETFQTPSTMAEYGFLVATFDSRSLSGRGRKFSDPFYTHMGIVEMDDQAAGVAALDKRPYVDAKRVGVYGTSYGGTAAATLLMRYPDLFQAASSSSPVTDYRNYNDIYPERFEGLVADNKAGYDAATVMTYIPNLKGRLLLYYGTADNNVHISNSLQLIQALQRAGKSFDLQVGPDLGHTGVNQQRMMEFFIENLVLTNP